MKITAETKCTILAISIEKDLRNWIRNDLLNTNRLKNLVDIKIIERLKIKTENNSDDNDDELINGADFSECYDILNQHKNLLTKESKLIFEDLSKSLLSIKHVRDRSAHKNLLASDIDEMENFINKTTIYENIFLVLFSELKNFSEKKHNEDFF